MAFDKAAARGPSRTRTAASNARLEVPLPPPPPYRGFLESAHLPTSHPPHTAADGSRGVSPGCGSISRKATVPCAPAAFGWERGGAHSAVLSVIEVPRRRKEPAAAPSLRLCPERRPGTAGSPYAERGAAAGCAHARTAADSSPATR